jgi:hypothetical protein
MMAKKQGIEEMIQEADYAAKRKKRIKEEEDSSREYGRELGRERQNKAATRGGILGTPAAYVERAGQFIGDKFTDADAFLSEKLGMEERAANRRGERKGLKDEGYKKGGMVKSSASKRADGCAVRGKTKGKMV